MTHDDEPVDGISKLGRHIEGLQQAVEVAGHSLVH